MSPNVDWTTFPSVVSYKDTGNSATISMTVKLPERNSSIYYLRTDTVGSDNEIVEDLISLDLGNLGVTRITPVTSTTCKLNSVTASNYNAVNSTIDLKFTYSSKVYWYLRVEAMNKF